MCLRRPNGDDSRVTRPWLHWTRGWALVSSRCGGRSRFRGCTSRSDARQRGHRARCRAVAPSLWPLAVACCCSIVRSARAPPRMLSSPSRRDRLATRIHLSICLTASSLPRWRRVSTAAGCPWPPVRALCSFARASQTPAHPWVARSAARGVSKFMFATSRPRPHIMAAPVRSHLRVSSCGRSRQLLDRWRRYARACCCCNLVVT
mmetsp:Transcript_68367/g.204882  ORF Transcript_68367/g.204882 Transcript_68367/m.204882 type:complete len:205 (+) Transcript_68367:1312-1926(+)